MSVAVNISDDFQAYLQSSKPSQGLGSVLQVKNNLKQLSSKFPFSGRNGSDDSQKERLLSDEPLSQRDVSTPPSVFGLARPNIMIEPPSLVPATMDTPTKLSGARGNTPYKDEAESANFFFWKSQEVQSKPSICPTLTRMQRLTGFVICLFLGVFCFGSATFYIPLLVFKARKFVALYTLGCVFIFSSFAFLKGPSAFVAYVFSRERLLFTVSYGGSLAATVYFSIVLQSTVLTILAAVFQFGVLLWFLIGYIPGGSTGVSMMARLFSRSIGIQSLPI